MRAHYTTHSPPQRWCLYGTKGRGTNDPHRQTRREVPDIETDLQATPAVSMDLMYLYENGERPTLVAANHEIGRVWSYALKDETILGDNGWIQKRTAQDIDNAGHKADKIIIKSDHEKAMVAFQHEIQRLRDAKTIIVNSPVGESESNGRVENAIGLVQDKIRTLKCQVKGEAGIEIGNLEDLMMRRVRWSSVVITRSHTGKDKKTAYERIRDKSCCVLAALALSPFWRVPLRLCDLAPIFSFDCLPLPCRSLLGHSLPLLHLPMFLFPRH